MSASHKAEVLELVRKSPLSAKQTLEQLRIPRSTYYAWRKRLEQHGHIGLGDRKPSPGRVWNRLLDQEERTVLEYAHRYTDLSPREVACKITDDGRFSVSESTVYRVLKRKGLITPAVVEVAKAEKEYHRKTRRVNEMWQTDLTYLFVHGWGWYYVGGVLDDYSRYLICCEVLRDMTGSTMSDLVQEAVERTGMLNVPVEHKVKLLSDNGSGYLSRAFNEYLATLGIRHILAGRCHPQTCGKMERLNRTAKDRLGLIIYTSPQELKDAVVAFQRWYNHERYHEAIDNLYPADMYEGRGEEILRSRKALKKRTIEVRKQVNGTAV